MVLGEGTHDEVGDLGVVDLGGLVDGLALIESLVEALALVGLLLVAEHEAGTLR